MQGRSKTYQRSKWAGVDAWTHPAQRVWQTCRAMSPAEAIRGRVFTLTQGKQISLVRGVEGAGATVRSTYTSPRGWFTAHFTPFFWVSWVHFLSGIWSKAWRICAANSTKGKTWEWTQLKKVFNTQKWRTKWREGEENFCPRLVRDLCHGFFP